MGIGCELSFLNHIKLAEPSHQCTAYSLGEWAWSLEMSNGHTWTRDMTSSLKDEMFDGGWKVQLAIG